MKKNEKYVENLVKAIVVVNLVLISVLILVTRESLNENGMSITKICSFMLSVFLVSLSGLSIQTIEKNIDVSRKEPKDISVEILKAFYSFTLLFGVSLLVLLLFSSV